MPVLSIFDSVIAPSDTISVWINPSSIADALMPVESINTPVPFSSYKTNVNSSLASRPICILICPFLSMNCIVLPAIVRPPSSDEISNLSDDIVPAFNIPTVICDAIRSRITASSICTFSAVSEIICPNSALTFPANKLSICATKADSSLKSPLFATILLAAINSACIYSKNPLLA